MPELDKKFKSSLFLTIFLIVAISSGAFLIFETDKFDKEISHILLAQMSSVDSKRKPVSPITLMFVGDIMLDRGVEYLIKKYGNNDWRFPFSQIADFLQPADILIGNLEGPISDKGQKVGSIYSFRSNPAATDGLTFAGFDILSIANNHVFDYGRMAMEDSFLRLKENGIDYIGGGFNESEAYSPIVKEIKGVKIAFLAYTNLGSPNWAARDDKSGIAWLEKEKMEEEIKKAKDKADLVIISFHYGEEYAAEPNQFQISISQTAIDAGADLVVGHHPHVVQKVEQYKKGWIAYSLGNFVFDQSFSEKTMTGLLLKVLIENDEIKEAIPIGVKINKYFQPEIVEKIL